MANIQGTPQTPPSQVPQTGQGVFIPQNTTSQTKNISESPVLSSPSVSSKKASNPSVSNSSGNKKKTIGIVLLVVLIVAGLVAGGYYFLRSQSEETQETVPSATAKLVISPPSGTLPGSEDQTLRFSLEFSSTPVTLTTIEFSVDFSGEVPEEIRFSPVQLTNFNPADASVTQEGAEKKLRVTYTVQEGQSFSATTNSINLGTLSFTSPPSGQMTIRFSASDSKAIIGDGTTDILRPANLTTYTFESATPDISEINTATDEAVASDAAEIQALADTNLTTLTPASSVTVNPSITQTIRPTATIANTTIASSPTPKNTVTPSPTPRPSATTPLSPTPTTSRQSSVPAETQEKPISGSMNVTVKLIIAGGVFIIIGIVTWKKGKESGDLNNQ